MPIIIAMISMVIVMVAIVVVMVGMANKAVRCRVAVNHNLGASVVFAFMNVLGGSQREQAKGQGQETHQHLRPCHQAILYDGF
jgi:hypothetical protein